MWRLDVPIFTADAHGEHLVCDHTTPLDSPLEISPVDFALRRIARLSEPNREQQGHYIAASLTTGEVASESFRRTCLAYAGRVGERLVRNLRDPGAPAPWTDVTDVRRESPEATGDGVGRAGVTYGSRSDGANATEASRPPG